MLGEAKLKQLHELIDGYSKEELIWINGYLSGIVANGKTNGTAHTNGSAATINGNEVKVVSTKKISLAFGTETGNAKRLATHLAAVAKKKGVNAKLIGLDQYRLTDLSKEEYFFVVISTQGEGEPPIPAKKFYDHIHEATLDLSKLKYSVLALGDTSYPMYCKTGEDVDAQFSKFGSKQVIPLQKCAVDYEEDAQLWFEKVLNILEEQPAAATPVTTIAAPAPAAKKGKKYYNGTILTNINLNDRGSNKQTYHIEIGTDETIEYEPGDTIGIVPRNREDIVSKIISLTGVDGSLLVETTKVTASVSELLSQHLNIC